MSKQGSSCEKSVSPLFLPNSDGFTVAIVHFLPSPLLFSPPPPRSKSRLQIRFYALLLYANFRVSFNLNTRLSSFFSSLGMFPFEDEKKEKLSSISESPPSPPSFNLNILSSFFPLLWEYSHLKMKKKKNFD